MKLTGFHVQAVGWLLVFNRSAVRPDERPELSRLWQNVIQARGQDRRMAPPLRCVLGPQSIRLSNATLAALAELLDYMAAAHPERFGAEPLRRRRNHWMFQLVLGFSLSCLAVGFLPQSWPFAQEIVATLVTMSSVFVLPLIMLWRTVNAVRSASAGHHGGQPNERLPLEGTNAEGWGETRVAPEPSLRTRGTEVRSSPHR